MTLCKQERAGLLITPSYSPAGIDTAESDIFIAFIEQILRRLLPQDLLVALSTNNDPLETEELFSAFYKAVPLLTRNYPEQGPCTLSINLLCHSEFTNGAGRYLCDIITRWLIPGKFLNISSVRSLDFKFTASPEHRLFFMQTIIDVETDQQLTIIKNNWQNLEKEIRLSILTVRHARNIIALQKLSSEEKKAIIEENIASVIDTPSKMFGNTLFDQMHTFWLRLSAEGNIQQIQNQFSPYIEQRPKVFDSSIFHEIKHAIQLFGDRFTGMRDLRHVSRLISYQYLFRKTLMRCVLESPDERHVRIKLIKTRIYTSSKAKGQKTLLGILGAVNVLSENELFGERHIAEAITHCLPNVRKVEHSFVLDRRGPDPIRLFYLEIEKTNSAPFSLGEMEVLTKNLPYELYESIESVLPPVLMPRNDEEIMRNIVLLSQQLKYLSDPPQLTISFSAQTEQALQFTVVLLRILRDGDFPLSEIFAAANTELKIEELEIKRVGLLRKRYPKESNVFKVSLDKKKFLRKDFTIDLFKARQEVSFELDAIFKGIRDFNGGIHSKQQEAFQQLKSLIQETSSQKDFLIENFFYSITPALRQTLIPPSSLKTLFNLMEEALDVDYKKEMFFVKKQADADQLLTVVASPHSGLKEELALLLTRLNIPSSELFYTHVTSCGIYCMGYLYQSRETTHCELFYSALTDCLKEWQISVKR
jgi:hypothetical protein